MDDLRIRQTELIKNLEYDVLSSNFDDILIEQLIYDTRKVCQNCAFVCIKGVNFDSHSDIEVIINSGAKLIFVEENIDKKIIDIANNKNIIIISVKNTRKALSILSINYFRHPLKDMIIIGITGTKGKTTTAYMIRDILKAANKKVGIIGTVGCEYNDEFFYTNNTTPESYVLQEFFYKMRKAEVKYVVMEVSSQSLMLDRVYGICFNYAVFTNISHDHIGKNEHTDFDDYFNNKLKIFDNCKFAIINSDDLMFDEIKKYCIEKNVKYKTFSIKGINKKLLNTETTYGVEFEFDLLNDSIKIPMPGFHNIQNSIIAIIVAKEIGIDDNSILTALSSVNVPGRVEIIKKSDDFTILVDYAHNEVGTTALINSLREYNPNRIVVVFGSGGNRDVERRYGMGDAVGELADFAVITADNSRFEKTMDIINQIVEALSKKMKNYKILEDRREAIEYAIREHKKGDVICVIGKGHEDYNDFMGHKYHFSDREEILKILNG